MWHLSAEHALEYLARRQLLAGATLCDAPVNCTAVSRRVIRVDTGTSRTLFLKQMRSPEEYAEVEFYESARRRRLSWPMAPWVSPVADIDRANGIVATLGAAPDIGRTESHVSRNKSPHLRLWELGAAVARLHSLDPRELPPQARGRVRQAQWAIRLHLDPTAHHLSDVFRAVGAMVAAAPALAERLHELHEHTETASVGVTHGDLRAQNVVNHHDPAATVRGIGAATVQLIDWETIERGTAEWDLGALLDGWLRSDREVWERCGARRESVAPIVPRLLADARLLVTSYQLHQMREQSIDMSLVLGCAVARLVQAAYETCGDGTPPGPQTESLVALAESLAVTLWSDDMMSLWTVE